MEKSGKSTFRSNSNYSLQFTGERMIPSLNKGMALFYEHLSRYLFSLQLVENAEVLDLGCGEGYGSYLIAKYGNPRKVLGIDNSKEAILHARRLYKLRNNSFQLDDAIKIKKAQKRQFDVVVAFELIEHLNDQNQFLSRIKEIIKDNGIVVISTPNKKNYPAGNLFHVKELELTEFKALLKKYFKYTDIFYQYFELAEIIKRDQKPSISLEEGFISTPVNAYYPSVNKDTCQYMIAVCSEGKIPNLNMNIVSSNRVDAIDLSNGLDDFNRGISYLLKEEQFLKVIKSSKFYKLWRIYSGIKDRVYGKK